MAPYFLSWVVVSFMAFSLFSVDDGLFNHLLAYFGMQGVDWYSEPGKWPFILTFFQIWKTIGYSTVMYISSLTGISNDYYEAAIIDGATKWQQIKSITLPCLRPMMIVLTILAIGRIFYADFGLFFQLPRDSTAVSGHAGYRHLCVPCPEGNRQRGHGRRGQPVPVDCGLCPGGGRESGCPPHRA